MSKVRGVLQPPWRQPHHPQSEAPGAGPAAEVSVSLPTTSRPPSGPLQAYYWPTGSQPVANRSDVDRIHIGPVGYRLATGWLPVGLAWAYTGPEAGFRGALTLATAVGIQKHRDTCTLHGSWAVPNSGLACALFPLTPALSLGEREPRRPSREHTWRSGSRLAAGERVSLSPRERAGGGNGLGNPKGPNQSYRSV